VPDAAVEIFQADAAGRFAPECDDEWTGFGRCLTSLTGGFGFVTVKPGRPASPSRAPLAPAVDVLVHARGLLRPVRTRMYFPDEPASNALDPVLCAIDDPARRATLVARPVPSGYRFDIHLQASPGGQETVFFAC
jgi:protocatechuate 3,4-dioxygenase alpha subunit